MPEFALIACRVTLETKISVQRVAERDGISESALLRQLVEFMLRTSGDGQPPLMSAPERVNRDARVNVRLEPEDLRLLRERSKARGMATATYLSYLARSHLRSVAPLPHAEYTQLKQSVEQLASVGRSLNQIARALNQGAQPPMPGRSEVIAMVNVAEALRDHFRGLLEANERSWRTDDDTTSH
jgi:hypothetical protein